MTWPWAAWARSRLPGPPGMVKTRRCAGAQPLGGDWGGHGAGQVRRVPLPARPRWPFSGTTTPWSGATRVIVSLGRSAHSRVRSGPPFRPAVVPRHSRPAVDLIYSPPGADQPPVLRWWCLESELSAVPAAPSARPMVVKVKAQHSAAARDDPRAEPRSTRGGWFGEPASGVVATMMRARSVEHASQHRPSRERVYTPTVGMDHSRRLERMDRELDVGAYRYRASTPSRIVTVRTRTCAKGLRPGGSLPARSGQPPR